MLFSKAFWSGLEDGSITVAFRRWKRPTVKAGGTLRSPAGLLSIDSVERWRLKDITAAEAKAAGYATKRSLLDALAKREGILYRIEFALAGPDPREALRNDARLDEAELHALRTALARSDERAQAPWTRLTLELIAHNPGLRAGDMAPEFGLELRDFKRRVRRLKGLGLTESLKVGYRLSARGKAYLDAR